MDASQPYFRPRDLPSHGLSPDQLRRLVRQGQVLRVGRGLYRWLEAPARSNEGLSAIGLRAPKAIVCLLSALSFHDIGTQDPPQVWIGVESGKWKPTGVGLPVRVVRFSHRGMTCAVETHEIAGVKVRITSPARTIVDCFRYRLKIGLDVALEALEDALSRRLVTRDALLRTAEVFRQARVMRPYLEAYSR
jgi:predicted transcriptional regulator of viral defense system